VSGEGTQGDALTGIGQGLKGRAYTVSLEKSQIKLGAGGSPYLSLPNPRLRRFWSLLVPPFNLRAFAGLTLEESRVPRYHPFGAESRTGRPWSAQRTLQVVLPREFF
jgi:hypothetical protein